MYEFAIIGAHQAMASQLLVPNSSVRVAKYITTWTTLKDHQQVKCLALMSEMKKFEKQGALL